MRVIINVQGTFGRDFPVSLSSLHVYDEGTLAFRHGNWPHAAGVVKCATLHHVCNVSHRAEFVLPCSKNMLFTVTITFCHHNN